jgi:hypothetical protein
MVRFPFFLVAKRKPKSSRLQRRGEIRQPYDRVLIICEGKTEEIYFTILCNVLRLSTTNIKVINPNKNTPEGLYTLAKSFLKTSEVEGDAYDRIYCIFDKDMHVKYQETKNNLKRNKKLYSGFSEPCFEYWMLLHYIKTDKPFLRCYELEKDKQFKQHFPKYIPGEKRFISPLMNNTLLTSACQHAQLNPHTNVQELVIYLQHIKS